MRHFCFARNVTDNNNTNKKTPWESRFGTKFAGKIIPFGAAIMYHPLSPKDQAKQHEFDSRLRPGLFGYYSQCQSGKWHNKSGRGFDVEELEKAGTTNEVHLREVSLKDVHIDTSYNGDVYFPLFHGKLSLVMMKIQK